MYCYYLLLRFVLADSHLQDIFLALKMFVLEGQDLNTGPGCLFLLQDVLLPSRMTYLFLSSCCCGIFIDAWIFPPK